MKNTTFRLLSDITTYELYNLTLFAKGGFARQTRNTEHRISQRDSIFSPYYRRSANSGRNDI